ncbi:uncharacterized protein PGTG_14263 [Puccinia graminis f. sp. tritici CRL 75-36-700-3]|uniref:Uncharacterized protein n=1 Tax=Puccinia graminis f. sp. tritici (strain CRL 75-36-700-3 / race SCCL) TaxID=418459 RepID=E3KV84_PUCGT|nr:uncharacterized protein PGTG_14263 [Puccinia graminis f. sp. tritici CRL 75-36-700-3]EFP88179.2 hypothetical protein PGTG_14263 [Puccinia graminis f. sp. tritici CRL 75-36-700-3]
MESFIPADLASPHGLKPNHIEGTRFLTGELGTLERLLENSRKENHKNKLHNLSVNLDIRGQKLGESPLPSSIATNNSTGQIQLSNLAQVPFSSKLMGPSVKLGEESTVKALDFKFFCPCKSCFHPIGDDHLRFPIENDSGGSAFIIVRMEAIKAVRTAYYSFNRKVVQLAPGQQFLPCLLSIGGCPVQQNTSYNLGIRYVEFREETTIEVIKVTYYSINQKEDQFAIFQGSEVFSSEAFEVGNDRFNGKSTIGIDTMFVLASDDKSEEVTAAWFVGEVGKEGFFKKVCYEKKEKA